MPVHSISICLFQFIISMVCYNRMYKVKIGPEMILGELKECFYWPGHCTELVQYMENISSKATC